MQQHLERLMRETFLHAWILMPAFSPMGCRVIELSEKGATIKVIILLGIPDLFEIAFEDKRQHRCKVIQRWPNKVKVAFEG